MDNKHVLRSEYMLERKNRMKERTYMGEMTMEELSGYINSSNAPFSILIPLGNGIDTEDFRSMDKAYRDPVADDGELKRISSPDEVSVHE